MVSDFSFSIFGSFLFDKQGSSASQGGGLYRELCGRSPSIIKNWPPQIELGDDKGNLKSDVWKKYKNEKDHLLFKSFLEQTSAVYSSYERQ